MIAKKTLFSPAARTCRRAAASREGVILVDGEDRISVSAVGIHLQCVQAIAFPIDDVTKKSKK